MRDNQFEYPLHVHLPENLTVEEYLNYLSMLVWSVIGDLRTIDEGKDFDLSGVIDNLQTLEDLVHQHGFHVTRRSINEFTDYISYNPSSNHNTTKACFALRESLYKFNDHLRIISECRFNKPPLFALDASVVELCTSVQALEVTSKNELIKLYEPEVLANVKALKEAYNQREFEAAGLYLVKLHSTHNSCFKSEQFNRVLECFWWHLMMTGPTHFTTKCLEMVGVLIQAMAGQLQNKL